MIGRIIIYNNVLAMSDVLLVGMIFVIENRKIVAAERIQDRLSCSEEA